MEEFTNLLQDITIDESAERSAIRKAMDPVAKEIEKNTTKKTGKLAKLSKTVKKEGFATVGIIKTKAFYGLFEEFGTSMSKHNVGYFDRSVKNTEDEAIKIMATELLKKIR